jgi:trehalose transport system substrate-binding protein
MLRRFLLLFSVLALLGSACRPAQQAQTPGAGDFEGTSITFSISLAEAETAAIESLLSQFEEDTGAEVELTAVTSADLPEKLKVDVGANRPTIHLFAQDNLALTELVDEDLVEDLSDVEIPDGVVESMIPQRFDDKQFFLPFRPNVRVAYVNNERFEAAGVEPPTTVEELRETAEMLKAEADGSAKVTFSLAEGDPAAVTISEFVVSFGGDPLILNDEGSVEAFEFIQGMWRDELLAQESLLAKFDTEVDYIQGETAWLAQNWPFTSSELAKQDLLDRFDVYAGWTGPEREAHVIGGDVLGITKGVSGEELEAAVALAQFLMSKETQEALAEQNAWPSIRDDAYGTVPEDQQETFEAIQGALENGYYRPNVAYWSDVSEQMNVAIRRIVEGGEDAKTVLDELHANIEQAAEEKGVEYPPPSV